MLKIAMQNTVKKIFSIETLFKIAFLYSIIIIWIIVFFIEIPSPFTFNKNKPTIAIYGIEDRIGELMALKNTKVAARNLKLNIIYASIPEGWINSKFFSPFFSQALSIVNLIYRPKFNLSLTHHFKLVPIGYNIAYLNVPNELLFNEKHEFLSQYKHLKDYQAYIDINTFSKGNNHLLGNFKKVIPGYISMHKIEYRKNDYNKLLITGSLWGCIRNSLRVKLALKQLAEENKLDAYGVEAYFKFLGPSYKGLFRSRNPMKFIDLHKKYGISLLIHNLEHILDEVPTNRILEASAAGNIIISDEHPFIKKHFGDNVLYFNSLETSEKIYSKINEHYNWIINNPALAEKKAKACHDIYLKHFTIEQQLQEILQNLKS